MKKRAVGFLALAGCAATPPSNMGKNVDKPSVPSVARSLVAAERQLEAEEKVTTAAQATLTVAKGWWLKTEPFGQVLSDPDHLLSLTIVELDEPDSVVAIARAWKQAAPAFQRTVEHTVTPPSSDGWDEIVQQTYATSPSEGRVVIAVARRKAKKSYVFLIDGKQEGFSKRGAQVMTAVSSLKVKGVDEESFAGKTPHALDEARMNAFSEFVEESRKKAEVPGLAVAIVRDGKVVFSKGFGERQLGIHQPVSPSTRFMIGSMTKPLSTLLTAKLVDEKKLEWDTPVTSALPSFALADPEVTKKLTMRHTACACTGMPRRDLEFIFEHKGVTAEARIASMNTMKPTTGFGETFQYSNLLVAAGGYAAAHAAYPNEKLEPAYEHAMAERIFLPLGMKHTSVVVPSGDRASSHGDTAKGEVLTMPLEVEAGVMSVAPAGAVWSTVDDISRYMLLELGEGTLDGKQVVSKDNLLLRRKPQVKITNESDYGLGLFVSRINGLTVVGHGGNNMGFTSDMFFIPEHKIGMVVLTNMSSANRFTRSLQRRLLELLFDGREEAARNLDFAVTNRKKIEATELAKLKPVDPAQAKNWVGDYRDADLGQLSLRLERDSLIADAGEWKSKVSVVKNEDGSESIALVDPPWGGGMRLQVKMVDGKAAFVLTDPQHSYEFRRVR